MGPWTAVPALVALCTDPADQMRAHALRLMCQLAQKHQRYVDADRLMAGLGEAFAFHCRLSEVRREPGWARAVGNRARLENACTAEPIACTVC